MAKWIMIVGALLLIVGAIMYFVPGLFSWFGKLPGDIRIETEHSRIFIPLTSMIIISIVLTLLLNLFRRL